MPKEGTNFAFIDTQNLYQGVKDLGWRLDWVKFRRYLREKYNVGRAYLFLGYIKENERMYRYYQNAGYELKFKKTSVGANNKPKGNVDVFLTLQTILEIEDYRQALIVTSDGDFYPLAEHLIKKEKLISILSPHIRTCSRLLKDVCGERIGFLSSVKEKISQ